MKYSLLLCCLLATVAFAAKLKWYQLDASYSFETYLEHYGKQYTNENEYKMRKEIFQKNLKKILAHNQDSSKTWKEEINHFADWTPEEFKRINGYDQAVGYARKEEAVRQTAKYAVKPLPEEALPTSVDWRTQNIITPVKDQGNCGSCWSFATAETIESYWALKQGYLWILSEQQILDCTSNPNDCGGTGGCEGGTTEVAMATIQKLGGLSSEWTYPYLSWAGKDQPKCLFDSNPAPPVQIGGYVSLPSNEYAPLLTAVATVGPISISVDASAWSFYGEGIFNGCNQVNPDIDHAVQLVGYGTENGTDYWLVRNSWTPTWGENGYIRLLRNSTVQCGVDLTPGDGDGCNGGPPNVTVCGTCGILYDTTYPIIN